MRQPGLFKNPRSHELPLWLRCSRSIALAAVVSLVFTIDADAQTESAAPVATATTPATTTPEAKHHEVPIAEGSFKLFAPGKWQPKKPRNNIIQHEFSIPAAEGDEAGGRVTLMAAGGSIEANIARWLGQFRSDAGEPVTNAAKPKTRDIAGQKIHLVDLAGTYADKPRGPFGPTTNRPSYRMLAAIIETKEKGRYYVKAYGPAKTMAQAEKGFRDFVGSLKLSEPSE